jgi:hypothetical protein
MPTGTSTHRGQGPRLVSWHVALCILPQRHEAHSRNKVTKRLILQHHTSAHHMGHLTLHKLSHMGHMATKPPKASSCSTTGNVACFSMLASDS